MPRDGHVGKSVFVDDKTYNVVATRDGGMGRVWLLQQAFDEPYDPIFSRKIAVKTFEVFNDDASVERELNIWISLRHASILPLRKLCRLNYRLAALMPMRDGNLDDILEDRGAVGSKDTLRMLLPVVEALEYSWTRHRVLHLDLKPSNILFAGLSNPRIEVADWGIARLAMERNHGAAKVRSAPSTVGGNTSYAAGTLLFMAPERFSGNWSLNPRADIYSLGLIAIQLATGVLPFRLDEADPIDEIMNGGVQRNASGLLTTFGEQFRKLCLMCIERDPSLRPGSYRDVLALVLKATNQDGS